jgi:hypothetical protein
VPRYTLMAAAALMVTCAGMARAEETRTSAAVVVSVSSDALAIVSIPQPGEFSPGDTVTWSITTTVSGSIVGKLSGIISPGTTQRSVVLALRAPRRVAAGPLALATVRFDSRTATVVVPIIAEVAVHRSLTISVPSRLVAARPGSPVRIPWRVTNSGNANDSIRVAPVIPAGWIQLDAAAAFPLAPQQSVDGATVLLPPPHAQGLTTVRLVAMSNGQPAAEASVDLQVAGEWAAGGVRGPELRIGVAAAGGPWAGATSMHSVELQGPISDGLTLRARAATTPGDDAATYALNRAGMTVMPLAFQLAARTWRLDGGTLGASVSDLAGASLIGRGAGVAVRRQGWSATAVALTPDIGSASAAGSMTASRLEVTRGSYTLSTAASRLRETRGTSARSLDAFTLGGSINEMFGGRFGAEVAQRRHAGGAAAGWATTWLRRTHDESFDFRYAHAPGGSKAFARAAEELSLNGSRRISDRLHVSAGGWRSRDEGTSLSDLHMSGLSFGANIAVDDDINVVLGARQSGFDARTALGAFGSGERGLDATLDVRRDRWTAEVTGSFANLSRTTTVSDAGEAVIRQSAPRAGARGSLTLGSPYGGSMAFTGRYERVGPGVGAAPEQWAYGLRLTARPTLRLAGPSRLEMSAERVGGSTDAARSLVMHAAVEMTLPLETALVLSAERNPYVVPAAGSSDWIYVVGLARSVSLPRLAGRGTRGVVYRDLNGNGRRETGEPGFAGVVLRRGAAVATTDRNGAFLLTGDEHAPYQLDARSLPVGWLPPSTVLPASRRLIGAVAVSPLEVTLRVDAADSTRVTAAQLADVVVTARDSAGREWPSRRLADDRVVFDAVPPGNYTIVADASDARDPLRATSVRATVQAGRASTPVTLVMRPRQLRFSPPRHER